LVVEAVLPANLAVVRNWGDWDDWGVAEIVVVAVAVAVAAAAAAVMDVRVDRGGVDGPADDHSDGPADDHSDAPADDHSDGPVDAPADGPVDAPEEDRDSNRDVLRDDCHLPPASFRHCGASVVHATY
jgi:hypothetical protein